MQDTLGGHTDAMEGDLTQPIVSVSLGCKAVFLLGGPSRDDPPVAFFLRSGDVMMLSREARYRYHGKLDDEHLSHHVLQHATRNLALQAHSFVTS